MNHDISPWRMSSTTLNDRSNNEKRAARFKLLLHSHSITTEDDKMKHLSLQKINVKEVNVN